MLQIILSDYSTLFPLTEVTLRGLHAELLRFNSEADYHSSGYKHVPDSEIQLEGGREKILLKAALPGTETELAMASFINWYNGTLTKHPWTIAVGVEFIFRFLANHPFQDGNG